METRVIYNGGCPICSAEIAAYRRHAEARGLPLRFEDLRQTDLAALTLTPDAAVRRLHVVAGERLLSGLDAFIALWRAMPRYAWLARAVDRPGVRPVAGWLYDRVAAPALYALHRRRTRRA